MGFIKKVIKCAVLLFIVLNINVLKAQDYALKTNALYWLGTTPNIGFEAGINNKWTIDVAAAYNPWKFKDDRMLRFWLVQPEARYWFCESFEGHFVGIHAHGTRFYSAINDNIYDGWLAGAGLTYGYAWILSSRWTMEAGLGLGYARLWYKQRPNIPCKKCEVDKTRNYFGPTKVFLSFSYLF